jgi:glycosyltransferase involved in cell wall biosynthesis
MNSLMNGKLISGVRHAAASVGMEAPSTSRAAFDVLLVDPSLFTAPYDEALAAALMSEGLAVTFVGRAPRAGEMPPQMPFEPRFYRRFDAGPRRYGRAGAALKAMEHVIDGCALVRSGRPQPSVTHFQWLPFPLADTLILRLARRRGPVVVTVHDTAPFNGSPTSAVQRWGFMAALHVADRLIVHTESGRGRLLASGLASRRVRIIPHGPLGGVDKRRSDNDRWTIVAFGKMRPYKGLDVLIAALALLTPATRAGLRVVIAGEPLMDLAPLRAAIDGAGLGSTVEIVPRPLDEDAMQALFAAADTFVFPYREIEASGVFFLIQGLARWVIASRLGAFPEAIEDGVSGRLVAPGDPAELARALAEAAERRPRPTGAPRVADWGTIARATIATYGEACRDWASDREVGR